MATFETNYTPVDVASFGGRLSTTIRGVVASVKEWNDARMTRIALSKLSDRELDDIGLCRADIGEV